ncbi:MAG: BBP7 family outer membrane beta-barrel protein [Chlamydiales bacterium]
MSRIPYKFLFLVLILVPGVMFARLPCCRYRLAGWWAEADYLLLWRKGRFYPPLVTTSLIGTPEAQAGVLGDPNTFILFGNTTYRESPVSGIRVDAGLWLTRCLGFGTTYISGGNEQIKFRDESGPDGIPILARPFVNMGVQERLLVSYPSPGLPLVGDVRVDTGNRFWVSDCYARYRLSRRGCTYLDLLGGFMYSEVEDDLDISSNSSAIIQEFRSDHFKAENNFYGALIGALFEYRKRCYAIQIIGKAGIGSMAEKVEISGMTEIDGFVFERGLLATPAIIGDHSSHDFQIVPELLANFRFRIYPQLWWTLGYMFIMWPRLALAGDQVSLNTSESTFEMRKTYFWAQGFTTGLYVYF